MAPYSVTTDRTDSDELDSFPVLHDDDSVETPSVDEDESTMSGSMSMSKSTNSTHFSVPMSNSSCSTHYSELKSNSYSTNALINKTYSTHFSSPDDIYSIDTPSIQEEVREEENEEEEGDGEEVEERNGNFMLDKSTFGQAINTVIRAIMGNQAYNCSTRTDISFDTNEFDNEIEDDENPESVEMEQEFDDFLNEYSVQSVDIMKRSSVGLVQVMSTCEQEERHFESDDEDTPNLNVKTENVTSFDTDDKSSLVIEPRVKSVISPQIKSTKRSRSNSRSRRLIATGLKGLGRRVSRSMSPSPTKNGHVSVSETTLDYSKASNAMKSKTNIPRMRFAKPVLGNPSSRDLDQRKHIELLLYRKMYKEMLDVITENPKLIAIQANQPSGKTLLHVMADMSDPPPETVMLKIISIDTSLVLVTDHQKNTPLHYASQYVCKDNMHAFTILLKFHPKGASERNSHGDLPLHIVASNSSKGAEEAAHLLLETHSKAISEPNNKGKIPLHFAFCEGSRNLKLLLKLVKMHMFRKVNVDIVDSKGNSPLHCAILYGTKYDAIDLFNKEIRESFLSTYMKENEQGNIPLHLALTKANVDPLIILSLIQSAPFSAGKSTPKGVMPVALATKANMKPEIVKLLLASDLPIELGSKNGEAGMGVIVEREHGHSWWHVAVECHSKYVDVITSLLSDHATFVQIVALQNSLGPDGKTRIVDAISDPLESGIRNLLRFYYRYEISMRTMPICSNEIQSFAARDHGEDLEKMKVTGPWLNTGFTTIEGDDRKMRADNKACEIAYVPWNRVSKEVTLRCYAFDDAFLDEKRYREQYDISSTYFEKLISIHNVSDYSNASFTSGKLLCITFEKSDRTLRELMDDEASRANRNWLMTCHLLLKDIAVCLDHLHKQSLVHGGLDATTIAQFQSKWKLMYIGHSSRMGRAMVGGLKRCVPPESLSGSKVSSVFKATSRKSNKGVKKQSKLNISSARTEVTKPRKFGLPPLPKKQSKERKKFGVFVFGLKDLGLGDYGSGRSRSISRNRRKRGDSIGNNKSVDSSIDSYTVEIEGSDISEADAGSLRIIAMQENEIARLRQALEEKEHIYRRQLIEERAEFKRQEIERQRELQKTKTSMLRQAKENLFRYAPEKVMASPTWDIWSFGVLMVELIIGKTPLLPSFATSDDEFIEKLMLFDDDQLAAIREEVRENAGDLAADLVARLLHPKPSQRIESMSKVLQHKYFHEEVKETKTIFTYEKKRNKLITTKNSMTSDKVSGTKGRMTPRQGLRRR